MRRPRVHEGMTVEQALGSMSLIERMLAVFFKTAPTALAVLDGVDWLTARCCMTCIGPIPSLSAGEWESMSREYADRPVSPD